MNKKIKYRPQYARFKEWEDIEAKYSRIIDNMGIFRSKVRYLRLPHL